MCLACCSRLTWQCCSCLVALFGLVVSFVFGPFYTILYFTNQTDLPDLLLTERENGVFYLSIMAIMCIVFVAKLVFLVASCSKDVRLLNIFTVLALLQMVFMNILTIRYFVICMVFDKHCFDHTKGRKDTDFLPTIGLLVFAIVYNFIWLAFIFVACNLKLVLTGS